ncbi:MAG: transcription-repair coupling factor, partial [Bacteroidota bacterium]
MALSDPTQQLLERYSTSPRVAEIARWCQEGNAPRLQLKGLAGALESFLLAASYRHAGGHYLVVATDKEEAAYIQNTIASLLPKKQIRLLPDSFRRPRYFEVLDPTNVLLRTETINYLTHSKSKGEIVVTYPEALFEQVVAPSELTNARIEMSKGETLDVDTIIEVLVEYGFKRQEFVYEPGQFSIRGGIVDIFSYGNEYPYRIELFDDEIESIRTFDPLEQRSVDRV